jgi:hypothetical protein
MANQIPVRATHDVVKADGCCTPKEDKQPQKVSVPPKKVLPIVFIPGIMGSNLRLSAPRQAQLKKKNNIAWRPDRTGEALALVNASAARRQLQLDPRTTEVDIYEPDSNPTGDKSETAAARHDIGTIRVLLNPGIDSPLLTDDPVGVQNPKTKEMKARERGWGEVYFGSYRAILERCELAFNHGWLLAQWGRVFKTKPTEWGSATELGLKALLEKEHIAAVSGYWFPVHAMGYNWLESNADSAKKMSVRIRALIKKYKDQGYECDQVILMTHSMGGLVARALIHPKFGGLVSEVLGIVHGAMPATGAPAAYKRMRCGFEEAYGGLDPAPKVLGNFGSEVTAVLANAQGGLELLPSRAYGNGWLEIRQKGILLHSLPKSADPYNEIYKLRDKWFGLLREAWINPADLIDCTFQRTCELLNGADQFHSTIENTYHQLSYAHYGADPSRPSWEGVVWELDQRQKAGNWQALKIATDSGHGRLELSKSGEVDDSNVGYSIDGIESSPLYTPGVVVVSLGKSFGLGDQTVPLRSAEHQFLSGKFKGIFRQVGYEHQASYGDKHASDSTLYSLSRIIGSLR